MTDPTPLECEIASLRLKALRVDLLSSIVSDMAAGPARRPSDRFLVSAIAAGVAATVVIVTMLSLQTSPDAAVSQPATLATSPPAPRFADSLAILARAGSHN